MTAEPVQAATDRQPSGSGALSGITILDCGTGLTAPFACQLLRGMGAEVIKLEEPAAGDELRGRGPFLSDVPSPERSGLFQYVNGGKKGISLDLRGPTGRALLHRLVTSVQVVVEDRAPAAVGELGLDVASLQRANPGLIVASITPFGRRGPLRDAPATDLTLYHMAALAYATPGLVSDPPTHPPLRAGSYQGSFIPALGAAINISAAIVGRELAGDGEAGCYIDFSCYEAMVNAIRQGIGSYSYHRSGLNRDLARGRGAGGTAFARNIRCKDGYFQMWVAGQRQWESLRELMGNPAWMEDERASPAQRATNWAFVEQHLTEWAQNFDRYELFFLCQGRSITCAPVNNGEELVNSDVLASRGFWDEVLVDGEATVRFPGPLFKMSATPWVARDRAPRLGEHNRDIYCDRLGLSASDLAALKHAGVI